MVVSESGALTSIKRHDYLPFGEELNAGIGGRSSPQGYSLPDNVRQKFNEKERDIETGLDYFIARYFGSSQGRFTSIDPLLASARPALPQSWNRYTYALNNPLRFTDLDGLDTQEVKTDLLVQELRDKQQSQPLETTTVMVTQIQLRPVYEIQSNSVSIFTGTFPKTGGDPANQGQPATNPAGTTNARPFGVNLSVNYTLTNNGVPVQGVEIFEEVTVEGTQIVKRPMVVSGLKLNETLSREA